MFDLVSKPTVCISPEFDLMFVNKLMIEKNFRRLPVMENGKMIGIITQTDVARELYLSIDKNKEIKYSKKDKIPNYKTEIIKKQDLILYQAK
jgi:CBS domain-containing protein